jgi:hypothetical protein
LKLWSSAWAKCKTGTDDNSKRVAGDVMAQWTRLLASLGRLEELDAIYTDAAKTGADLGSLKPLIDQTKEGVARMASKPGIAYRCGTYALYNVGKALQPTNPALEALNNIDSPLAGFSMGELVDFARSNNIPVKAVRLRAQDPLPVPSVVHWSENHYAAIVAGTNGMYKVIDPTFRETKWISEAAIREETSGRLLVPVNSATASMEALAAADLKNTRGKGYPNDIDDGDDGDDSCDDNPDAGDPTLPDKGDGSPSLSGKDSPAALVSDVMGSSSPRQAPPESPSSEEPPQSDCGEEDDGGDGQDCGCSCPIKRKSDTGMPVWRVSQPYQTLWLSGHTVVLLQLGGRNRAVPSDLQTPLDRNRERTSDRLWGQVDVQLDLSVPGNSNDLEPCDFKRRQGDPTTPRWRRSGADEHAEQQYVTERRAPNICR